MLMIVPRLPCPPADGGRLKNHHLVRFLSRHFNLSVVAITHEIPTAETLDFYRRYTERFRIFVKPRWRSWLQAGLALFTNHPLQVGYFYFRDVQEHVDRELASCDLAVATLIRTAQYLEKAVVPRYLDIVDSIALHYERARGRGHSSFWNLLYSLESGRLRRYEEKTVAQFTATFFVNAGEARHYSRFGNVRWIPLGVDDRLFSYKDRAPGYDNSVAFFGSMSYRPNIDAVLWFTRNVLPRLDTSIRFVVAGGKPAKSVLALVRRYPNVEVTGYLKDPYRVLNACRVIVAPMWTGGGMQTKVLECMALGKAVVTTPLTHAAFPGFQHERDLLVAGDTDTFTRAVVRLFEDQILRKRLGQNAQKRVRGQFHRKCVENKLHGLFRP